MHVPAAKSSNLTATFSKSIPRQHTHECPAVIQQQGSMHVHPIMKAVVSTHLLYAPVADESKSLTDKGSRAALYDASGLAGAAVGKERSGSVTCC